MPPALRPLLEVAAVAALFLPAVPVARAAPSGALDDLRSELLVRQSGLEGRDDPQSILHLAAVVRCVARIEAADALPEECVAAGRVAVTLLRAFPSEFRSDPGFAADLSDHTGAAFQSLVDRLYSVRGDLLDRAQGLRPRTAFRVRRAVDACDARLRRAFRAEYWSALARRLAAAARALDRGIRIAEQDTVK